VRQALLELEPPSGRVFPRFFGGENGQPSAQRANDALITATIKSTRLVANTNRPEGNSAFPVSPYHTTQTTQTLYPQLYKTRHRISIHPVDHLVDWQETLPVRLSIKCLLVAR
jgi:hypothetical protein